MASATDSSSLKKLHDSMKSKRNPGNLRIGGTTQYVACTFCNKKQKISDGKGNMINCPCCYEETVRDSLNGTRVFFATGMVSKTRLETFCINYVKQNVKEIVDRTLPIRIAQSSVPLSEKDKLRMHNELTQQLTEHLLKKYIKNS